MCRFQSPAFHCSELPNSANVKPTASRARLLSKQLTVKVDMESFLPDEDGLLYPQTAENRTFSHFRELSFEIRLKIWQIAVEPRIIMARDKRRLPSEPNRGQRTKRKLNFNGTRTPALLHVCHEARKEVIKFAGYGEFFKSSDIGHGIYFSPFFDALLIADGSRYRPASWEPAYGVESLEVKLGPDLKSVRHFMILPDQAAQLFVKIWRLYDFVDSTCLERVSVVVDPEDHKRYFNLETQKAITSTVKRARAYAETVGKGNQQQAIPRIGIAVLERVERPMYGVKMLEDRKVDFILEDDDDIWAFLRNYSYT